MNPRARAAIAPPATHAVPIPPPPRRHPGWLAALALGAILGWAQFSAPATTVKQMDLAGLSKNADKIIRGTVVAIREGTIQAGGGPIPTVTYRIEVSDAVSGKADRFTEFTAVNAPSKAAVGSSPRFALQGPDLKVGREYLLFLTRPSRVGLSTVVGLGQGAFEIRKLDGKEMAINQANNQGLGAVGPGPAEYNLLAGKIRSLRAP